MKNGFGVCFVFTRLRIDIYDEKIVYITIGNARKIHGADGILSAPLCIYLGKKIFVKF